MTQQEFDIRCMEWPYLMGCKLIPVSDDHGNPV